MLLDESDGTDQAVLLPVGEEEDEIARGGRTLAQGAQGLQHGRHPHPVVAGAGLGGGGVVVAADEDDPTATRPLHPRHDVLHPPRAAQYGIEGSGCLHLGIQAQAPQFAEKIVAHPVVLGRTGGLGGLPDGFDMAHGPGGGEDIQRRIRGNGSGSAHLQDDHQDHEGHPQEEQRPLHAPSLPGAAVFASEAKQSKRHRPQEWSRETREWSSGSYLT